jgi:hypothetical protein
MSGYSYAEISRNAANLIKSGLPRNRAIMEAISAGRVLFFQKHPHGALPGYLQYPKGRRLREHYDQWGKPIAEIRKENPEARAGRYALLNATSMRCATGRKRVIECAVIEPSGEILDLTYQQSVAAAREYLADKGITDIRQRGTRKTNPASRAASAEVQRAADLYHDFTGHTDLKAVKIKAPTMPKAMLAIGHCDGVLYSTVRDGKAEKYIHRFRKDSRPLLTASPDGKQLFMLGGAYDFTERGIVDKPTKRRK